MTHLLYDGVRCTLLGTLLTLMTLSAAAQSWRVTVLDAEDRQPLPGVILRLGRHTYLTDGSGLALVPTDAGQRGDRLVGSFVGYDPFVIPVANLRDTTVYIHPARELLGTVEVVAQRTPKERTMVGEVITSDDLHRTIRQDLTDALTMIKGVSSIGTGSGEGVPVIHGLSGNRILIIRNGVRQEAQQWNVDFGTRLHAGHAGMITVLKGAESVRYGSDALGGVIIVDSPLLPYGERTSGRVGAEYGSNGRSFGADLALAGSPMPSIAYRLQAAYANAGDRSTATYLLNNTGSRAGDLDLSLGWKGEKGLVELFYNLSDHDEGIYFGAQLGSVDQLQERIRLGRPVETAPFSRSIAFPRHRSVHYNLRLRGEYHSDHLGTLALCLAYQRDRQREYHFRRMDRSSIPSVSLTLDNAQGDFTWSKNYGPWSSEVGSGVTYSNNYNQPGTGVVPLIPNYVRLSGGLYGVQKYQTERLALEAGGRVDALYLNAEGIDLYSRSYGGERRYLNLTAMAAAHYHLLPSLALTTQLGSAWRAPHVAELWSEGLDAAGGLYLKGDETMGSERALKWIAAIDYSSSALRASIEGYLQWIGGYIYKAPTGDFFPVLSGVYPLFRYRSTSAFLRGVDAEVRWSLTDRISYRVLGGIVLGNERSTGRYLPFIPPFRLTQTLDVKLPLWRETTIGLSHKYVAMQRRFDPEQDLIPYAPPAYHLLGLEAGTMIPLSGEQSLSIALSVSNLLNKEYKEYTNLSRYYAHDLGRDVRLAVTYHF